VTLIPAGRPRTTRPCGQAHTATCRADGPETRVLSYLAGSSEILSVRLKTEDALSLLDHWKTHGTLLLVHISSQTITRDLQTIVTDLEGSTIRLKSVHDDIQIDVASADFDGELGSPTSKLTAFLVCKVRDHRWAFYAVRGA